MSRKLRRRRSKLAAAALLPAVSAIAGVSVSTQPASSSHIYATYGNRGYLWLARYTDFAETWVSSDGCDAAEVPAFTRVRNSTAGTSEFAARWPNGLRMVQTRCDFGVDETIDIKIDYDENWASSHSGSGAGGENHSYLADQNFCDYWGAPYPCGSHTSVVHINQPKWAGTSAQGRERLLMHETGHSQGLAHHCSGDSIMNDGRSGCNGGRWLQVMTYRSTDRTGINNVYPGWRYP